MEIRCMIGGGLTKAFHSASNATAQEILVLNFIYSLLSLYFVVSGKEKMRAIFRKI